MQHQDPYIHHETFKILFPKKLVKTFREPWPDHENNLKNYVLTLLSMQNSTDKIEDILIYTATVDRFNNAMHYWIIKNAFFILPPKDFRGFLLKLVLYLPYSTFLL